MNSVENLRKNIFVVLDILRDLKTDYKTDKKTKEKSEKLYARLLTYENMFLIYTLTDILLLCSRVCKQFQSDNCSIYTCMEIIKDLKKNIT